MKIDEALEDIDITFRQLEFAIKLLSFCEMGNINPKDFDTDHVILLDGGNLRFPPGQFSDQESLNRAASISVLLAFGASVFVLDKGFEAIGIAPNHAPRTLWRIGGPDRRHYQAECNTAVSRPFACDTGLIIVRKILTYQMARDILIAALITSKITSKAQTTIPQPVRAALHVGEGDELAYRIEGDHVILTKAKREPIDDPFATFHKWSSEADRRAYGDL